MENRGRKVIKIILQHYLMMHKLYDILLQKKI